MGVIDCGSGGIVGGLQPKFEHVLRPREVLQLPHPEVGQHDVVGKRVDDEFGCRA